MKGFQIILISSLLMITASCKSNEVEGDLNINDNVKQVVFFSNEGDYQFEGPYYDAIIELKQDFPDEMKNMLVLPSKKAKKYYDIFRVKDCPAILVIYKEKIVAKVDGKTSKDKIVMPISKALSKADK